MELIAFIFFINFIKIIFDCIMTVFFNIKTPVLLFLDLNINIQENNQNFILLFYFQNINNSIQPLRNIFVIIKYINFPLRK